MRKNLYVGGRYRYSFPHPSSGLRVVRYESLDLLYPTMLELIWVEAESLAEATRLIRQRLREER